MNYEKGYIGSNLYDAKRLFDALEKGPVGFTWMGSVTRHECFMIPQESIVSYFEPPDIVSRWTRSGMVIFGIEKLGCFHFNLLRDHEQFSGAYVSEKLMDGRDSKDAEELAHLLNFISDFASPERRNIIIQ